MAAKSTASNTSTTAASTPSAGLVWEEPPAADSHKPDSSSKYQAEADEMRQNPKRWAVLATVKDRSQAYRLKSSVEKAKYPAFAPAGSFEAVSRTNGAVKVYARYVGEPVGETAQ